MRIMYFLTGLTVGGGETVTTQLASLMLERGHKVCLVYLAGENHFSLPQGMEVHGLGMSKTPWGLACALYKARQIVSSFAPDVVHANMVHAVLFARMLRVVCKIRRLVCSEHNTYIGGDLRMFAYRLTDRLSDFNTNVSQEALDVFVSRKSFRKSDCMVMYNGIPSERFRPMGLGPAEVARVRCEFGVPPEAFLFINVGRLTEAKDQDGLLTAFSMVHRQHPEAALVILGEGELRQSLEAKAASLGLAGCVRLIGVRSNPELYYNASDCFVLSSAWEGFGLVVAEAMCCSLPVVCTNSGGVSEVVQDDSRLVPAHNPEALAGLMAKTLELPSQQRAVLGQQGLVRAQRFAWCNILSKWEDLYRG